MLGHFAGRFEDDGHAPRGRVSEQLGEGLGADVAVADSLVVVAIRTPRILRIVGGGVYG